MASLLFEVSPVDPLTYALVSLTLIGATVLASYVPALRATRVDPIGALRAESKPRRYYGAAKRLKKLVSFQRGRCG